jgi:hypothetical protein
MNNNIKCGYYVPIQKLGHFTFYDKLNLICIIILGLIYFTLTSNYFYVLNLNKFVLHINISFIGLLLSLCMSTFMTTYILREYDININLLIIISIISFLIILWYYLKNINDINLNNNNNNNNINKIIFPLLSSLFFIIQYTLIKFQNKI